jgi:hypothetical protein
VDHPKNDENTPTPAHLLLVEVQIEVEPERFGAAVQRGKQRDLETVFAEVEADLREDQA